MILLSFSVVWLLCLCKQVRLSSPMLAITIWDSFVVSILTLISCTIAASNVHSKLDYCNSLYYNLPKSQITRLQLIQNSLAHAVVKAPKSCHITPVLRSLHWLKINERIEYKLLSLTYKVLTTNQPPHLHHLISVQPPSTSSQHSLFNSGYPRSTTNIILATYNWLLLPVRLTLSLESTS